MRTPKLWLPPDVPFTVHDVGVGQDVLERAAARGAIVRLARGVYINAAAVGEGPSEQHLLAAAGHQRRQPELVASHATAALAHGLPLLDQDADVSGPANFTVPPGRGRRSRTTPRVRVRHLPRRHVMSLPSGLDVTTPVRTAVDLASEADLPTALVALDFVARTRAEALVPDLRDFQHGIDPGLRAAIMEPIVDAVTVVANRRTTRHLQAVLAAVDPRRESPLESYVAGCIHESDLPQPTPQLLVETPEGDLYGDLGWESFRTVLECDGMLKYTDPRSLHVEKSRELRMRGVRYRVERVGWAGAHDRDGLIAFMRQVLVEQGMRG